MVVGFYNPQNHWLTLHTLFESSIPLFTRNFLMIGPLVALATLVVLVGLLLDWRGSLPALGWLGLCGLLIALNLPQMSWFWAPGRIPLVEFIQFPWRLLGPAALAASVALGAGMAAMLRRLPGTRGSIALLASVALLLAVAWPYVSTKEMHTADVARDSESVRQAMVSATDADEYLPAAAHQPPPAPARQLVERVQQADVSYEHQDGSRQALVVRARRKGAHVTLALHSFPGWQIETLSGPGDVTLDGDEHGLVRLTLPKRGKYDVRIWFGASPATQLGYGLSILTLLALGFLLDVTSPLKQCRSLLAQLGRKQTT